MTVAGQLTFRQGETQAAPDASLGWEGREGPRAEELEALDPEQAAHGLCPEGASLTDPSILTPRTVSPPGWQGNALRLC